MKAFNKLAYFKWIFGALLFSICCVVGISALAYGSNAEGDIEVKASKTVEWLVPGDYSKGKIELEANVTGKVASTPDVLFVGTMCHAHDLTAKTIARALNAITETSNVDYFLFNNENPERQAKDKSGSLVKDQKVQETDFTIDTDRNHQALGKFFKCIYEQHQKHVAQTGKGYDFVILEFDGTRISDWYRHLSPKDETSPTTPDGTYNKYINEVATVNILKNYYSNSQVIWITDKDWTEGVERSGYWPGREMNVRAKDVHTRVINYNSLLGLLAPELYVDTGDTPGMSQAEIEAIENNMDDPTNVTDPVPAQYVLTNDRQVGYENSEKVGDFLEEQIKGLYTYTLKINDYVDIDDNIKFSINDVKLYEKKNVGDAWQPYTGTYTPTINPTTGQVYFEIPGLEGDEFFKVEIVFENKSSTDTFIETSIDGIPNDGPVHEEVIPDAGGGDEDEATPEEALDWPVKIYYKVEDQYIGKGPEVSSSVDEDINSIPTEGHYPKGSVANIGFTKYTFTHWTLGESGSQVSDNSTFVPTTATDGINNGRYHEVTYVAHFTENPEPTDYALITYHVQGADIAGIANPVIPSDSLTPGEESVMKGTKNYYLKGIAPTTSWTTSDGTDAGTPGTWTFFKLDNDVWFTDNTYSTKISPIAEVNQDTYDAYGKWIFTPTPTPIQGSDSALTGDGLNIIAILTILATCSIIFSFKLRSNMRNKKRG